MNAIDSLFQRLRAERRKAFIPFITAGDPDLNSTGLVLRELADAGADLVEIGFPYSDPIADGPVIQASYSRALDHGLRVQDIFRWIGTTPRSGKGTAIPLVGMVSYSLVHRRGIRDFLESAGGSGLCGLIVPDLPLDESSMLAAEASARDLKLIQLVTPTTPPERCRQIARTSTGFLYCVSVTGITGERREIPEELIGQLQRLRHETDLPLCVGFGVSKPAQAEMLRPLADGVIVGSALVRRLEEIGKRPANEIAREIGTQARAFADVLHAPDRM